jgi:hypothetical protein
VLVGVDSGAPGRPYRPILAGLIRLRIGSAATTSCMPPNERALALTHNPAEQQLLRARLGSDLLN